MGADGRIEEAAYTGHGCAVSQASADIDRLVEGLEYVWSIFHG
jgi:NifU-like protein involved in Fe-S cluster formation